MVVTRRRTFNIAVRFMVDGADGLEPRRHRRTTRAAQRVARVVVVGA